MWGRPILAGSIIFDQLLDIPLHISHMRSDYFCYTRINQRSQLGMHPHFNLQFHFLYQLIATVVARARSEIIQHRKNRFPHRFCNAVG